MEGSGPMESILIGFILFVWCFVPGLLLGFSCIPLFIGAFCFGALVAIFEYVDAGGNL